MTWNYRIMRHKNKTPSPLVKLMGKFNFTYGLHEVFYLKEMGNGWTEDSMIGHYESKKDLISALEMMLKDAKKKRPILEYK